MQLQSRRHHYLSVIPEVNVVTSSSKTIQPDTQMKTLPNSLPDGLTFVTWLAIRAKQLKDALQLSLSSVEEVEKTSICLWGQFSFYRSFIMKINWWFSDICRDSNQTNHLLTASRWIQLDQWSDLHTNRLPIGPTLTWNIWYMFTLKYWDVLWNWC